MVVQEDLECREDSNHEAHKGFTCYHPGCQQYAGVLDPYLLCFVKLAFACEIVNTAFDKSAYENGKGRFEGKVHTHADEHRAADLHQDEGNAHKHARDYEGPCHGAFNNTA